MSLVCATDFSRTATEAATIAAGIARRLDEELVLVHVLELPTFGAIAGEPIVLPLPGWSSARRRAIERRADEALAAEARRLGAEKVRVRPVLAIGETASEILAAADDEDDVPLVVVGSHGRGAARRLLLGSVADRLARTTEIPLLVVREDSSRLLQWTRGEAPLDVLVGIEDFDGLANVAALGRLFYAAGDTAFHYAHVLQIPSMELYTASDFSGGMSSIVTNADAMAEELVRTLARKADMPPTASRVHVLVGRPAVELVAFANRFSPGLVLVGTHARKGVERALLGSVATGILHRSSCPVAIAPIGGRE